MAAHSDPGETGFTVDQHGEGELTVVALSGELDLETAPVLRHRLHDALAAGCTRLVVDLAGLSFMDSTGISVLVDALKQAERLGGSLVLRRPTPATERVLEITGLLPLFGLGGEADRR